MSLINAETLLDSIHKCWCDDCTVTDACDGCFIHELIDMVKAQMNAQSAVDHPIHYNRTDAMECIDEMLSVFGVDAVKWFCLCNVWKYRYRAGAKNGEDDIAKSDWYMRKYIEIRDKYRGA